MELENKLKTYYVTAVLGVLFAVVGFAYNTWRLEVSEDNNNIRTASFEVLRELAELEQVVYAAHYDRDEVTGSPRKGWVKVGLILDLSSLISDRVQARAQLLREEWGNSWESMPQNRDAADRIVAAIDAVRGEIKEALGMLD